MNDRLGVWGIAYRRACYTVVETAWYMVSLCIGCEYESAKKYRANKRMHLR